jgi:uncharacterized membrane protein
MYVGGILTFLLAPIWLDVLSPIVTFSVGVILLLPGGLDGTTQMFGDRESTNRIRAITGFLLGMGIVTFLHGLTFSIAAV